MVEFITGASGSGKSTCMIKKINELAGNNEKICVIVPEQFSHEFDKNLYMQIGAEKFNNLLSLSFTGFARELFQMFGDGGRSGKYADETARMILIYQAIEAAQSNPQSKRYFNRQSERAGFAEEMLKLIEEMKKSGISPQRLMEKAVLLDKRLMDKTNDAALIYLEYERLMNEYGFKDSMDDLKEASEIANLHGYFKDKNVFIDEFESFTGDQLDFIKILFSTAKKVFITLRTDDINAERFTLFETVNNTYRTLTGICRELNIEHTCIECKKSYRFKHKDLEYLSENILRNKKRELKVKVPASENIKVFEARDFYSEAEYVCASIRRLLFENKNLKYKDIAVISNNIEEYAEVLSTAFQRYDIPYFLSIEKQVMHTSVMIFFSTLLDIVTARKYNSELLFRYLKCRLLDVSLTEISMLENYCYKWSIDGDIWKESFTATDSNLEQLEGIRAKIIGPLEKLKNKISGKKTAVTLCKHLYTFLCECEAERNTAKTIHSLIIENKDNEAAEIKRLWSCLIDMLDSISETLNKTKTTASELKRIIKSLIGRITYSLAPQTLDSVTAASARTARLNSPKVVFVMGANDGDFPNTVNTHGIFSESDKQKLSETGIDISRRLPELIASERLVVYKSFSAASEKLFISYSLSNLSGQQKYSAPVIDDIVNLFGNEKVFISELQLTPTYYAVTMKAAFYHYMQDMKLNTPEIVAIKKLLLDKTEYKRRLSYVFKRSGTKGNFSISTSMMEKLISFNPLNISPTSLEKYNRCHFQYFCSECLKLFKREKIDLSAQYTGNIIHECFYNIISSRNKSEFTSLSYKELEKEINLSANKYLEEKMGGDFSKSPRFELGFRKLTERLTKVLVHTQQELMASSFTPKAFEINLKDTETDSMLTLPFGDGKSLSFGGIIDRADTCSINGSDYIRIVDYKSSRKNIDPLTLSSGINLQMLLYMFTITEESSIFANYAPAGVLYSPVAISALEADEMRNDTENSALINSKLKASGLVLGEKEILEAMEHNMMGKYIPAKLDKQNEIDEKSSCLSKEGFAKLKEYTYNKLIEMAESLYTGDTDANPLILSANDSPCSFCDFANICGNNPPFKHRSSTDIDVTEAKEILNMKTKEEGNNGMDTAAE